MVESVECLRDERVPERLWEAEGRINEATDVGKGGSIAIELCFGEDIPS